MKNILYKCKKILFEAFSVSDEEAGGVNYRYYHGIRTMNACQKILKSESFSNEQLNKLALMVAALFHDIGKVAHIEKDGILRVKLSESKITHEELGSQLVYKYLKGIIKKDTLDLISSVIRSQHNIQTKLIEAKILHDADELDSIGLINTWRMFTYSGKNGRSLDATLEYYHKISRDSERKVKLHFDITKQIARKRRQWLARFISQLEKEYKYEDF